MLKPDVLGGLHLHLLKKATRAPSLTQECVRPWEGSINTGVRSPLLKPNSQRDTLSVVVLQCVGGQVLSGEKRKASARRAGPTAARTVYRSSLRLRSIVMLSDGQTLR